MLSTEVDSMKLKHALQRSNFIIIPDIYSMNKKLSEAFPTHLSDLLIHNLMRKVGAAINIFDTVNAHLKYFGQHKTPDIRRAFR